MQIRVLGGFDVLFDGAPVPPVLWARRHAAALVKLLAITDGHRLHSERVISALWPALSVAEAKPRLHKAAYFARKALESGGASIALRNDIVELEGRNDVVVDLTEFRVAAKPALSGHDPAAAERALELYGGDLLPDDLYEEWTGEARDEARFLHLELLRSTGRWEELAERVPADEDAHLALARRYADRGDIRGALRQLERLESALRHELGGELGPETRRLKDQLGARSGSPVRPPAAPRLRLVARKDIGDRLRARLASALEGRGGAIVLRGPAGVGKSALLDLMAGLAAREDLRVARWAASSVEGQWPYGPVMAALGALCRAHPALLDALPDPSRSEIERALSGGDIPWTGESSQPRLFVAVSELVRIAAEGTGLVMMIDDVHEADDASLRLLHYLARCAHEQVVLVVVAGRRMSGRAAEIVESMVAREEDALIDVPPLPRVAVERLLAQSYPDMPVSSVTTIAEASAGLPFTALELARRQSTHTPGHSHPPLPAGVLRTVRRAAMLGSEFSTDEFLAMSGMGPDEGHSQLGQAIAALIIEPADVGYRFRHSANGEPAGPLDGWSCYGPPQDPRLGRTPARASGRRRRLERRPRHREARLGGVARRAGCRRLGNARRLGRPSHLGGLDQRRPRGAPRRLLLADDPRTSAASRGVSNRLNPTPTSASASWPIPRNSPRVATGHISSYSSGQPTRRRW